MRKAYASGIFEREKERERGTDSGCGVWKEVIFERLKMGFSGSNVGIRMLMVQ